MAGVVNVSAPVSDAGLSANCKPVYVAVNAGFSVPCAREVSSARIESAAGVTVSTFPAMDRATV